MYATDRPTEITMQGTTFFDCYNVDKKLTGTGVKPFYFLNFAHF